MTHKQTRQFPSFKETDSLILANEAPELKAGVGLTYIIGDFATNYISLKLLLEAVERTAHIQGVRKMVTVACNDQGDVYGMLFHLIKRDVHRSTGHGDQHFVDTYFRNRGFDLIVCVMSAVTKRQIMRRLAKGTVHHFVKLTNNRTWAQTSVAKRYAYFTSVKENGIPDKTNHQIDGIRLKASASFSEMANSSLLQRTVNIAKAFCQNQRGLCLIAEQFARPPVKCIPQLSASWSALYSARIVLKTGFEIKTPSSSGPYLEVTKSHLSPCGQRFAYEVF